MARVQNECTDLLYADILSGRWSCTCIFQTIAKMPPMLDMRQLSRLEPLYLQSHLVFFGEFWARESTFTRKEAPLVPQAGGTQQNKKHGDQH